MSVCQQSIRRRCQRRLERPKGLRAVSRTTKSLIGFAGTLSKTARKSGAK